MTESVSSHLEDCDEDLRKEIEADIRWTKSQTGIDVSRAEVDSVDSMGEAAGTCVIETGAMKFREDTLAANNAKFFKERRYRTGSFRHVSRHEAEHANGNRLEGTTELVASKEVGVEPVPAYRSKVRGAKVMTEILGYDKTMELARQKGAELLLFIALFQAKLAANTSFEAAASESADLVEEAA